MVTIWGKVLKPNEVTAHNLHPDRRTRIKDHETPGTDGWFRFDRDDPAALSKRLLIKLEDPVVWSMVKVIGNPEDQGTLVRS